jgi:tripeptidyl-peptidase-1
MFAPSKESVDSVLAWLDSSGIASDRVSQSVNKQWLQFDADAEEAETLIRAEYHVYSHSDSAKSHLACRE